MYAFSILEYILEFDSKVWGSIKNNELLFLFSKDTFN